MERNASAAVLAVLGIVALVATAGIASAAALNANADAKTTIYDAEGKSVGSITGNARSGWVRGTSGECWVSPSSSPSGTIFYAGQTHHNDGGAVPSARGWKVWFRGTVLSGTIVLRSPRRADLYARSGQRIGHTISPDPVAAGAARLILDREGCTL